MTKIFMVKDKNEANFRKPFVSLHTTEQSAKVKVAQMQSRLTKQAQELVSYEGIEVTDFDSNKTHVYVILDKTNPASKIKVFFDFTRASKVIMDMKRSVPAPSQKLISTQMVELS